MDAPKEVKPPERIYLRCLDDGTPDWDEHCVSTSPGDLMIDVEVSYPPHSIVPYVPASEADALRAALAEVGQCLTLAEAKRLARNTLDRHTP